MTAPIVVLGLGQLGSWFQDAFVAQGRAVVAARRGDDLAALAEAHPEPELVLVTVGEDDLEPLLAQLPEAWRGRVGLLQNELRPDAWRRAGLLAPTVLIVWFERKAGMPPRSLRESVACGPGAALVMNCLLAAGLPVRQVQADELDFELCLKNLFILVLNLCGLETRGTAGALLDERRVLYESVRGEVLTFESLAFGRDPAGWGPELASQLERVIRLDPEHAAAGRSAPRRLQRLLEGARELGLTLPRLEELGQKHLP